MALTAIRKKTQRRSTIHSYRGRNSIWESVSLDVVSWKTRTKEKLEKSMIWVHRSFTVEPPLIRQRVITPRWDNDHFKRTLVCYVMGLHCSKVRYYWSESISAHWLARFYLLLKAVNKAYFQDNKGFDMRGGLGFSRCVLFFRG